MVPFRWTGRDGDGYGRGIVGVIRLHQKMIWVDRHTQPVISWGYICDIEPLAVQKSRIDIGPASADTLIAAGIKARTGRWIPSIDVFQTESLFPTPKNWTRRAWARQELVRCIAIEMIMSVTRTVRKQGRIESGIAQHHVRGSDVRRRDIKAHEFSLPSAIHTSLLHRAIVAIKSSGFEDDTPAQLTSVNSEIRQGDLSQNRG